MAETPKSPKTARMIIRAAVLAFFFCQGLCFASWASRIPEFKTLLQLTEAGLGTLLLAIPAGQLTAMPFSGKLVTYFGSKRILTIASPLYPLVLVAMGYSTQVWQLAIGLYTFGVVGNMLNISVNTQGITAEKIYGRPIMASFHGGWSLAGFTGAAIGTGMISMNWEPKKHFALVAALVLITILLASSFLIRGKVISKFNETAPTRSRFFKLPETSLLQLGVIGFCCMATEGAMFDWSGVYFQKVVRAPHQLIVLGYAAFMCTMAGGRFLGDWLVKALGQKRMLQVSGSLIATGLGIAVVFPYLVPVTIGFLITGFGVSSVIPTVYSAAGRAGISPGLALTSVSGVSFFGFLLGPPLIGYIAQLTNLRFSYATIALLGFCTAIMAGKAKLIR